MHGSAVLKLSGHVRAAAAALQEYTQPGARDAPSIPCMHAGEEAAAACKYGAGRGGGAPAVDPVDVLAPAVREDVEQRGAGGDDRHEQHDALHGPDDARPHPEECFESDLQHAAAT